MFRYDSGYRRGLISIALCVFLLVGAAGCANSGSADDGTEGGDAAFRAAAFPVYVTENPIMIEDVPDPEMGGDGMNSWWARVTGLSDDAVARKINDRLREKYEEIKLSDPPPYRGLRTLIPEDAKPESEWINFQTFGNINNILSVFYTHARRYSLPGEDASPEQTDGPPISRIEVVTEEHPLNFNLITGDEITLDDLFGDGRNAFKPIDAAALAFLRDSPDYYASEDYGSMLPRDYRGFTLIGSYVPVNATQKFLISERELELVLDHETPQYAMDRLSSQRLFIPLTELGEAGAAAIKRFVLPEEETSALYATDASPVRRLLFHGMSKPSADSSLPGFEQRDFDGVQLGCLITGTCETTPEFERLLLNMLIPSDDEREALRELLALRDASDPGAGEPLQANINIYFMRYGNVFVTERYLTSGVNSVAADGNSKFIEYYVNDRRSFDARSLAPLNLEDIFVEGFDYESPLRAALDKYISDTYASMEGAIPPAPEERERLFEELLANGVYISDVGMMFSAPPASRFLDPSENEFGFYPWLYYADIGYENLVIMP
ncbi:MAG: hypothetical protein LBK57_04535 [Clostridiales Family XIII bacterium]|jgi:hypothetical protein|nr:hypothetical protein [Clostridiales Family XIII bacterium]